MNFFGPVFYYDLIRTSRRVRYFFTRFIYALVLFILLYFFYDNVVSTGATHRYNRDAVFTTEMVAENLARFAEIFFAFFMFIQFIAIILMTPAYTGSAIAEEKERKTLEFLLATDLRNREIVFGKLASRLGNILMFLIAGLPILALVQFFGGIDPNLLLVGFLMGGITVLSIASVCIYCSVKAKRSRDAIIGGYSWVFLYLLLWPLLGGLYYYLSHVAFSSPISATGGMRMATPANPHDEPIVHHTAQAIECFLAGNPFHAMWLFYAGSLGGFWASGPSWTGINLGFQPWELLRNYAIFHGIIIAWSLLFSLTRLRKIFLKQTYGGQGKAVNRLEKHLARISNKRRIKIGNTPPMVWKEVFVPRSAQRTWGKWIFNLILIAFCLSPFAIMVYEFLFSGRWYSWGNWEGFINGYVRFTGMILGMLLILTVGVKASLTVAQEREKQTMETLISTVLTDREIMFGKWLGGFLNWNVIVFLLLLVWGLGLATGGLHPMSFFMLIIVLSVYCAFAASLGVFFSSVAKSTTRALGNTLFWLFVWGGAHWLFVGLFMMVFQHNEVVTKFALGNTPAIVLWFLTSNNSAWSGDTRGFDSEYASTLVGGVLLSAILALIFFFWGVHRFNHSSGRLQVLKEPTS